MPHTGGEGGQWCGGDMYDVAGGVTSRWRGSSVYTGNWKMKDPFGQDYGAHMVVLLFVW